MDVIVKPLGYQSKIMRRRHFLISLGAAVVSKMLGNIVMKIGRGRGRGTEPGLDDALFK